jgi:hypothetical protein
LMVPTSVLTSSVFPTLLTHVTHCLLDLFIWATQYLLLPWSRLSSLCSGISLLLGLLF